MTVLPILSMASRVGLCALGRMRLSRHKHRIRSASCLKGCTSQRSSRLCSRTETAAKSSRSSASATTGRRPEWKKLPGLAE